MISSFFLARYPMKTTWQETLWSYFLGGNSSHIWIYNLSSESAQVHDVAFPSCKTSSTENRNIKSKQIKFLRIALLDDGSWECAKASSTMAFRLRSCFLRVFAIPPETVIFASQQGSHLSVRCNEIEHILEKNFPVFRQTKCFLIKRSSKQNKTTIST